MTNGERMAALAPSKSTVVGGGLGLAGSVVVCWIFSLFGISVPGEVGAALGSLLAAGGGYFFDGGRRRDTQNGQ